MGVRNAVGGGSMGLSGVGLAVPLRSGSLRALRPRAGQTTQAAYRVGLADALVGKTLAARARDRGRRRRWVCLPESPGSLPEPQEAHHLHHPPQARPALYEPAPPRKPHQMGRPRLKGERLANLSAVLEDPKTAWTPITVSSWYGGGERAVDIVSETAIWYSTGLPAVPIRWVLIRDPEGDFQSQALLCTDLSADPARIISWFVRRWQMESTFQEVRQRLGFETQRHWSEMAIQRTAPALLTLFSLVALFAHQRKVRMPQAVRRAAWYEKSRPTFSDALALVRKELWAQQETFCGSLREADTLKVP